MRSFLAAISYACFVLLFGPHASEAKVSLSGIVPTLASKAQAIERTCPGSAVISGVRKNARVAGTRRMSLHASGHAVDLKGNPACIYAQLKGWPGGYSTDYRSVNHVHVSLGGREDGSRFVHHHRSGHQHRYAKRHRSHRHYASIEPI